jgi:hypothetical protein
MTGYMKRADGGTNSPANDYEDISALIILSFCIYAKFMNKMGLNLLVLLFYI